MTKIYRLSKTTVIKIGGRDAEAIVHNLTTNHIRSLAVGDCCESFVTDVRGKMVGHVSVLRLDDGFQLIGAPGQSESLCKHFDRYTITEDATPTDQSDQLTVFAIDSDADQLFKGQTDWSQCNATAIRVNWLGSGSLAVVTETPGAVEQVIRSTGEITDDEAAFHHARVLAGFPWYGIDLNEKNLPQEASRIEQTISFTKGCYLGQETVARLDALGQVQKQLVRWKTNGCIPQPGSEVVSADKVVGRLTSIASLSDDTAIAIGIARRTHFEPGATADGDGFDATVIV